MRNNNFIHHLLLIVTIFLKYVYGQSDPLRGDGRAKPCYALLLGNPPFFCHDSSLSRRPMCVSVDNVCDGTPDCSDGSDEDPYMCEHLNCPSYMFRCRDKARCISDYQLCDGINDCLDSSDETLSKCKVKPMTNQTKPSGLATCGTLLCKGECIPEDALCDGRRQARYLCGRWHDESEELCRERLERGRCSDPIRYHYCGDGQCVSKDKLCDGRADCNNGADEEKCVPKTCAEREWECPTVGEEHMGTSITCIRRESLCDEMSDCENGEDEATTICENDHECDKRLNLVRCNSTGKCVPLDIVCSQYQPSLLCPMDYEEKEEFCWSEMLNFGCLTGVEGGPRHVASYFQCPLSRRCIRHTELCNGWKNCPGGEDETYERCASHLCKDETFNCYQAGINEHLLNQTICIADNYVCDGVTHCSNGADESVEVCGNRTCPDDFYFPCAGEGVRGTQCIYWSQVCDGNVDCFNGEDEAAKQCDTSSNLTQAVPCPKEFHWCNPQCIPQWLVCDGRVECLKDGSDEDPAVCNSDRKCPLNSEWVDYNCGDGRCIPNVQVCDGLFHTCKDGRDEWNSTCAARQCPLDSHFRCSTGQCLPPEYVCNGYSTCMYGEDEHEEACQWVKKLQDNSNSSSRTLNLSNNIIFVVLTSLLLLYLM